ncbi:mitochondrial import receptor subunit TOM40B-like, partial [Heptranchias perlo]|uniref:mitochondrial import receptor subunit TOM40B-like n=1 Tax=Heptranchias perlo TaxID=212740 RepID=UPI003559976B
MGNRAAAERRRRLHNPGSFERLHRKCKDVFPQQIEGVKLIINKNLSRHFQAAHTIHMSPVSPHYHFNTTYTGSQQASSNENFPLLFGEMDSMGSLNAHCVVLVADRIRAKAAFQTQQENFLTWQFDSEYRGDSFTATFTLGNPDVINESVILVAHFLQSVTRNLVLGGEMVYHRRPTEEGAILTLAGMYASNLQWISTLNIGRGGVHGSYYHQANDQRPLPAKHRGEEVISEVQSRGTIQVCNSLP